MYLKSKTIKKEGSVNKVDTEKVSKKERKKSRKMKNEKISEKK